MCESVSKDDLLTDRFDRKQYKESVDLPFVLHQFKCLTTFAFWSDEVRRLSLDLDPMSVRTDLLAVLPIFLNRTADVLTPSH